MLPELEESEETGEWFLLLYFSTRGKYFVITVYAYHKVLYPLMYGPHCDFPVLLAML